MRNFRPGVRRLLRLPARDAAAAHSDVDDELESLIAARTEAFIAQGMSPSDARTEALRRLGASLTDARQQLHQSAEHRERSMRLREHVEGLLHDLRYAARGLARRPLFTTVVVATLAIGIGATTAIFGAVSSLLLKPLPFRRPNELMQISLVVPDVGPRKGSDQMVWSYPKYAAFRDAQTAFSDIALYASRQFRLTGNNVEFIQLEIVGATYLRTLGLHVVRGRDFDPSVDAHAGAAPEVILTYAFWNERFGGDPKAIGSTIPLNGRTYTIIGVSEPGFKGLSGLATLFIPIMVRPASEIQAPRAHEFSLIGRRRETVTVEQASAATALIGARINATFPDPRSNGKAWGAAARPLDGTRVAPLVRRSILILFAAVTFVLLIACVNVANLLLGRASTRNREIAVRLAIGAGRGRLIRLLLAESALLATLGGLASIAIAWLGTRSLNGVNPATALRSDRFGGLGAISFASIGLDWRTLVFASVLTLVVGVLFGLVPALAATRTSLADVLKSGGPGGRDRGRQMTGRRALVVAEVAMAMVLLVGSGLMIRSLSKLLATNFGFDGRNVLTVRLTVYLPPGGIADSFPGFYDQVEARLAAIPGVERVGVGSCPPLNGGCSTTDLMSKDGVAIDRGTSPVVGIHWANSDWFAALGIPLKRGRLFDRTDVPNGSMVLLINETAARMIFPGENPIGHRIAVGRDEFEAGAEIVGVVGDVRQSPDSAADAEVYASPHQSPLQRLTLFLRTKGDPTALVPDVRRAIHEIAPRSPVDDIQTMDARTASATARARFGAILLGLFAATALSLAVVGIYGVMALAVTSRTREIGIRIALGADRSRVQRLVVGEGIALVGVGAAIGVAASVLCTRVLQNYLFDLSPSDPITYASIVFVLGAAATTASWLPARRAARVDPVTALRAD